MRRQFFDVIRAKFSCILIVAYKFVVIFICGIYQKNDTLS